MSDKIFRLVPRNTLWTDEHQEKLEAAVFQLFIDVESGEVTGVAIVTAGEDVGSTLIGAENDWPRLESACRASAARIMKTFFLDELDE